MKSLELKAHAKINLTLEVLFRRRDGFHQIRTVLQELELCDILYLEDIPGGRIELSCEDSLPQGEGNLAYEAARLLQRRYAPQKGVRIKLNKRIPMAAGLGGGSSDAAAVLLGLNKIWGLSLKKEILEELGATLGSDVPFFLYGGTALAEGRGELVRALPPFPRTKVLLAAPAGLALSAAQVYSFLNLDKIPEREVTAQVIHLLKENKISGEETREEICKLLCNHLELSVFPRQKDVAFLKEKLLNRGLPALLSGSGPTVFVLSHEERELQEAGSELAAQGYRVILTKTI